MPLQWYGPDHNSVWLLLFIMKNADIFTDNKFRRTSINGTVNKITKYIICFISWKGVG